MDEELKKAVADFYSPEELIELLSPFSADEFLELIDTLEEKLLENIEEIKEDMNYGSID
jgi:hypothetical protein